MRYFVSDIHLDFDSQPNSDIYTAYYDKTLYVDVPDDITDEDSIYEYIEQYIKENHEVEFDTPDWCEYEIGSADFDYRKEVI